jgi:hypothetical protein
MPSKTLSKGVSNHMPSYTRLELAAIKLQALGYLIESEGEAIVPREDRREIRWGISLLIESVVEEIRKVSYELQNRVGEIERDF